MLPSEGFGFCKLVPLVLLLIFAPYSQCQTESNCTVSVTQDKGLCVQTCNPRYLAYIEGDTEQCNEENIYLICCPFKNQFKKTGKRAKSACDYYHSVRNLVHAIYVGTEAETNEFPHMAALGFGERSLITWACGGSLISTEYILTAAHCVNNQEFGQVQWARLSSLNLKLPSDETTYPIIERQTHPNYRKPSHYNDIALLRIGPVSFGLGIKPACLHTYQTINSKLFTTIGWGKVEFLGDQSSTLLKTTLGLIAPNTCSEKYRSVSKKRLANGIDHSVQVCAGAAQGNDACPGDSGGPLQVVVDTKGKVYQHYSLVGITSFGKGCGGEDSAGVYTRVSSYIRWIENIVWPL